MVFVISMENHAPPFAMSAEQQLEHGLCLFAAPIVRRVSQQLELELVSLSTMRNHAPPILIKVE